MTSAALLPLRLLPRFGMCNGHYSVNGLNNSKQLGLINKFASTVTNVKQQESNSTSNLTSVHSSSTAYKPSVKQAWITSLEGGLKGMIELDGRVFGANPRLDLLQRYVVWQLAKRRAGTAKTKNRSEVRGGGRKPWPQKHTGRARQGSIRAPHFRGGGTVHGPRPRSYAFTLPRKVKSMALRTALSIKYTQGDLYIVDSLSLESHKTHLIKDILEKRNWYSVLFVDGDRTANRNLYLATRNLEKCDVLPSLGLNVHMMLRRHALVLSLDAVRYLQERLTNSLPHSPWDDYSIKMTLLQSDSAEAENGKTEEVD